jgi:hypothetical protein
MSPGAVLQWVPVIRELVGLGQMIADNVRKRRAARRKAAQKGKAK